MARPTGAQRRTEILARMLDMTADVGPEQVTTRRLAQELSLSEAALYRHFPGGKAEMWEALAERIGERLAAAWAEAESVRDPLERARRLATIQLRAVADTPALPAILLSRSLHRDNPSLRAGMKRQQARFHELLSGALAEAQAQGTIGDLVPDRAAWHVIALIQGTALRWSLSDRAFDLVREGTAAVTLLLAGLAAIGSPLKDAPA